MARDADRADQEPGRTGHQVPHAAGYLHEHVAGELRRRIRDGLYPPAARIPSVSELVREFGVSTITARRAVRDLCMEGLLVGRQGLGVFVANPKRIVRMLGSVPARWLREEMRSAGVEPGIRDASLSLTAAPAEVAALLGLNPGEEVYRHDKTILADGEPVTLDTVYLPKLLAERLRPALEQSFLGPAFAELGIPTDHTDYRFAGTAASETEAPRLGVAVGFPLLAVHYARIAPDGSAVFTGRMVSRSDRLTYEFCIRPDIHSQGRIHAMSEGATPDRRPSALDDPAKKSS